MTREQFIILADTCKIFNVKFVKVNGETRSMNGRLGVKSKLRGGTKSYSDEEKNIITVFDMNNGGYRSIKMENILELKADGKTIYKKEPTTDV